MTAEPSAQAAAAAAGASDVLDVTASVGLGTDEEMLSAAGGERDDVLDLTGGQGGEEALPDPGEIQTGDDLLDVTAHANLDDAGLDADPLDVTVSAPSSVTDDAFSTPMPPADTGNSMDFDLSLDSAAPADDDNMLEFESGLGQPESDAEAGGLELDLSTGMETPADAGLDLDIGAGKDDDLGLSLDMPGADDADASDLSLEVPGADASGLDLSFDLADTGGSGDLGLVLDADEEGADQTVFVPRTDGSQAQSAEDEIATKLDLAKAYVELGDKSSARGILDEIAAEGNEEQRRQAEELRQQAT
jgi:pilus assembly protein FimV